MGPLLPILEALLDRLPLGMSVHHDQIQHPTVAPHGGVLGETIIGEGNPQWVAAGHIVPGRDRVAPGPYRHGGIARLR